MISKIKSYARWWFDKSWADVLNIDHHRVRCGMKKHCKFHASCVGEMIFKSFDAIVWIIVSKSLELNIIIRRITIPTLEFDRSSVLNGTRQPRYASPGKWVSVNRYTGGISRPVFLLATALKRTSLFPTFSFSFVTRWWDVKRNYWARDETRESLVIGISGSWLGMFFFTNKRDQARLEFRPSILQTISPRESKFQLEIVVRDKGKLHIPSKFSFRINRLF